MTEIFTPGPYHCASFDPTINHSDTEETSKGQLHIYCTIRNVYGIVATTVAVLGIMGNVISLIILPRTGGARSAIILLFGLGVYDTLFLTSGIFLRYLPSISLVGHYAVLLANALSPIMFPIILLSHLGAAYTTIAISMERCIAVTMPLKVFMWLTTRNMKIATFVVFIWSVAYNVPRLSMLEPKEYWDASVNHTWIRLEPTKHSMSLDFLVIYFGYFNTIFKVVIPIVMVATSNAVLLYCLRRRHRRMNEHVQVRGGSGHAGHTQDARITSLVLAITTTFLVSQAFAGAQVLLFLTRHTPVCGQPCHVFTQMCDLVFVLVSATNFLFYYAFGQRFRKIIKGFFCQRKRKNSRTGSRMQTLSSSQGSKRILRHQSSKRSNEDGQENLAPLITHPSQNAPHPPIP